MKKTLRKEMIDKRRALSQEEWRQKSQAVLTHVKNFPMPEDAKNVMIFMDFRKEVQTRPIIEWLWSRGCRVVIPRVVKGQPLLELCLIESFDDFTLSSFGILEPKATHSLFAAPEDIDFVFMPGVAFTPKGARLGYGGGYYDQLIPLLRSGTPLVALAFDLQIVQEIPLEAHDALMDVIITESGPISCR